MADINSNLVLHTRVINENRAFIVGHLDAVQYCTVDLAPLITLIEHTYLWCATDNTEYQSLLHQTTLWITNQNYL